MTSTTRTARVDPTDTGTLGGKDGGNVTDPPTPIEEEGDRTPASDLTETGHEAVEDHHGKGVRGPNRVPETGNPEDKAGAEVGQIREATNNTDVGNRRH